MNKSFYSTHPPCQVKSLATPLNWRSNRNHLSSLIATNRPIIPSTGVGFFLQIYGHDCPVQLQRSRSNHLEIIYLFIFFRSNNSIINHCSWIRRRRMDISLATTFFYLQLHSAAIFDRSLTLDGGGGVGLTALEFDVLVPFGAEDIEGEICRRESGQEEEESIQMASV